MKTNVENQAYKSAEEQQQDVWIAVYSTLFEVAPDLMMNNPKNGRETACDAIRTLSSINYYARAYWHNSKGVAQRKSFAYSMYGKEKAWELAQEFVKIARNLADIEVDERDNHGK